MRTAHRKSRNSQPVTIMRHPEQIGLGWGHDLCPNSFWNKSGKKRTR